MRVTPSCDSIHSLVISDATGIQQEPDIVYGSGIFFAVWADGRGGSDMIYGARVSPAGTVLDPSGIAMSGTLCGMPAIAFDGSRFLVVWARSSAIEGVFVTTGGATQETVPVTTGTTTLYAPNIAFDGTNYFVVWLQWNGSAYDIIGQRISTSGSLVGGQITVAATIIASDPGLDFDGSRYIISWTDASTDIYARKYTTSGVPEGPAFPVSVQTSVQLFCDVCAGADRYLFVWGQADSGYDIYGNVDVVIGVDEESNTAVISPVIRTTIAASRMYFNNPEHQGIQLFNSSGRCVGRTTSDVFPCDHLAPGVYFVRMDGRSVGKIIKVR